MDNQWDESPRTSASRMLTILGWTLGLIWLIGSAGYLIWQIANDADSVRYEAILGLGFLLAFGFIVFSTLLDRLENLKTDPYREVKK